MRMDREEAVETEAEAIKRAKHLVICCHLNGADVVRFSIPERHYTAVREWLFSNTQHVLSIVTTHQAHEHVNFYLNIRSRQQDKRDRRFIFNK